MAVRAPSVARWRRRDRRLAPWLLALPAALFLGALLVAPAVHLGLTSFWTTSYFHVSQSWNTHQYADVLEQSGVLQTFVRSVWTGLAVGAVTTAAAFPVAYYVRFQRGFAKAIVLAVVITAMFSSYLVRIYAWRTLLGRDGAINWFLRTTGITHDAVLLFFYNRFAVVITLVHIFLPFAILVLLAALEGVEPELLEAGRVLGARGDQVLRWVVLPVVGRGAFAAFAFTFILSAGDYVTPQLVGGTSGTMTGTFVMLEFLNIGDYSHGAALSIALLGVLAAIAAAVYLAGRVVRRVERRA